MKDFILILCVALSETFPHLLDLDCKIKYFILVKIFIC